MLMLVKWRISVIAGAIIAGLGVPVVASAGLMQSSNFRLDPNVAASFGGSGSSASYKLTDTGGEAVVGAGSSSSYRLTQGYVAQLAHSLQLSVMPSGTYAYWPFDTGNGTLAYDVSTTNDRGNLIGTPSWTSGKIGQAITLNGTSQYVATTTTQTNPNPYSVELWFKTTTTSGGLLAGLGSAATGASGTRDRMLYMTNAGQLVFGVNNGSYKTIATTGSYNDGAWHQVGATLGPAGLTLVVDGLRVATDATTTTGANLTGYWRLGYDDMTGWPSAPSSSFFAGSLDEVRVYTRQLPDSEIKGDYAAGNAGMRFAHTLPNIVPGTSQNYAVDAVVQTDASGYDLSLQATGLLRHTDTTTTIPMTSGTIGSPTAWTEGTTKGLGFAVTSVPGGTLPAKWGSGPSSYNYAALPLTTTTFATRPGLSGGVAEKTTLQFRADTTPTQKGGTYSTTVVYTATMKP